jgi:hypothetical protein
MLSAALGFLLYTLVADPTENTVSIVIAQQYLDCCLRIRCRGNVFIEPLPNKEWLLWLHCFGFQASCPNINALHRINRVCSKCVSSFINSVNAKFNFSWNYYQFIAII